MEHREHTNKMEQIHQLIEDIQAQLARLQHELSQLGPVDEQGYAKEKALEVGMIEADDRETIIEGVFDGQNMVGPDGKVYAVPANYASKSKLVEGDIMKLTIQRDGSFIYKQIGPVKRDRIMGTLVYDETNGTYRAITDAGRSYRLLTASVTYFKGKPGEKVIMLIPQDMESRWAAVEHIMEDNEEGSVHFDAQYALLDDGAHGELPAESS